MLTITEAAARLATTPRALRYRETVGLLPVRRDRGTHRRYSPADLEAARVAADLEARYAVTPAALAFAVRTLTEPRVRADVARLAGLTGHSAAAALDFDQEKALRLLGS